MEFDPRSTTIDALPALTDARPDLGHAASLVERGIDWDRLGSTACAEQQTPRTPACCAESEPRTPVPEELARPCEAPPQTSASDPVLRPPRGDPGGTADTVLAHARTACAAPRRSACAVFLSFTPGIIMAGHRSFRGNFTTRGKNGSRFLGPVRRPRPGRTRGLGHRLSHENV